MSAYHENLDGLRIRIKLLYVKPVFIVWLYGLMSVLWYLLSTCGVRAKSVRALVSGHERMHGSACVYGSVAKRVGAKYVCMYV